MKYDLDLVTKTFNKTEISSREIAELTGKRHAHVIRDIRNIVEELGDDYRGQSKFGLISYIDDQNREQPEYILNPRATMLLLTGYSVKLRDRVLKRLEELEHKAAIWALNRQEARDGYKLQSDALKQRRKIFENKNTLPCHYMNEAKLIRYAMQGTKEAIDRDALSTSELDIMMKAEEYNSWLIRAGESYSTRKIKISEFVNDWKSASIQRVNQ